MGDRGGVVGYIKPFGSKKTSEEKEESP